MNKKHAIHYLDCCACGPNSPCGMKSGRDIYPHRPDLYGKRFWQCKGCGNYVGTHRDGRALGSIPTPEIRAIRQRVHAIIDPLWQARRPGITRKVVYLAMAKKLANGDRKYQFHTAWLSSVTECLAAEEAAKQVAVELNQQEVSK